MRFAPKNEPLIIPCFSIAKMVYCEQVGWYLHALGNKGEMPFW